jgi:hypothetical protein
MMRYLRFILIIPAAILIVFACIYLYILDNLTDISVLVENDEG